MDDIPTGTTALRCRSCGASLDAARLDRRLAVITCSHCGTLHEIPRSPQVPGTASDASPERPPVALPERFEVRRPDGGLHVVWPSGRKSGAVALAAFAAIWAGVTLAGGVWFVTPLSLVFLYMAAVKAFNRTELRIDGSTLAVVRGPLPSGGAKRVTRADIEQLWVSEHVSRTRDSDGGPVRERRHYRVSARLRGERTMRLFSGLGSASQALWLEQEIERTLGLIDRPVGGEYGRR